jgi:DNA-binding transcriptional regulator GbsR (MarR family)
MASDPGRSPSDDDAPSLVEDGGDPALLATCDAVGDIIRFWGFKKLTGVVWCFLYLSREPRSAREIQEALGISTGSVSMTLRELLHWGVVSRSASFGERSQRFTAEADLWRMVSRVLRERDLREIEKTLQTLRDSGEQFLDPRTDEDSDLARFRAERIGEMIRAGELVAQLLGKLLTTGRLNIRPLWPFILGSLRSQGVRRKIQQGKGTAS